MKKCNKCGEERDESEFHKNNNSKDGLSYSCKKCSNEQAKKNYYSQKQFIADQVKYNKIIDYQRHKKYRIKNKAAIDKIATEYQKKNKISTTRIKIITNPNIIESALKLKNEGLFVSDIAKQLTTDYNIKITQMSLLKLFDDNKYNEEIEITPLDYPSRKEIENLFSDLIQKEEDRICIFEGEQLKRKLMIRILNSFHNRDFTYLDARVSLNKYVGEKAFLSHWNYLIKGNYIEKVYEDKFKFCDRVKKWRAFDQI